MHKHRIITGMLLQSIACSLRAADWPVLTPEAAGMDRQKLQRMEDVLRQRRTDAFLVVRRGAVVYEWYAPGWNASRPHGSASLAKALVGGVSLLIAMNDGRIKPEDAASKFIPAWRQDPVRSKITVAQLATHTSGIEDAEEGSLSHEKLVGWKGSFWRREPDPFTLSLRDAPVMFEPGSRHAYSNPGMAALAYAVTASLQGSPHPDLKSALRERVFRPLEVTDNEWDIGYGRPYRVGGLELYANWGGGAFTARAAARVGLLMMQRGEWEGRHLFNREWIDRQLADRCASTPEREPGNPVGRAGLGWWLNTGGAWTGVPHDAFAGAGAGHQFLLVIPSLDMVVVRYGQPLNAEGHSAGFWGPLLEYVMRPVVEAAIVKSAYPPSDAVRNVRFAPKGDIRRQALDSDNWPLTWGDDDAIYTSYGDGRGFEPFVKRKLSMGFAKILGGPENFRGVNIRSATGEREGDGAKGAKASGMLMVDKTLYMWIRNVGVSQLAWSNDRGRTWHWGFKLDRSFGSPSFLNFGKNYSGAADGYVYAYSQDGDSAYESDNRVVLMRAPKGMLQNRPSWEFFAGAAGNGKPRWTRQFDERAGVFRNPRHCQRVEAVYHPGSKRYLLVVAFDHNSGWGIYDAPSPWGPWTMAYETERWDIDGSHGYRLPSKWFAADGRSLYLVFSAARGERDAGFDAFCVRRIDWDIASGR